MSRLSYEEFLEEIVAELKGMTDKKIIKKPVTKNNGVQMDAVILQTEGEKIAPTIYLNDYYQSYLEGEGLDAIAKCILKLSEQKMEGEFDTEQFMDFERAKEHILLKVIHAQSNEELLKESPHKIFLDLAVVFYYFLSDEGINGSILIRNEHRNLWDVSVEELYNVAIKNTPSELEPEIKDMNTVMSELFKDMPELEDEQFAEEAPMYVVTNKKKFYGAACLLYPGLLRTFAEMRKTDFYILPSSVHEILLIPFELGEPEELSAMVCEVNETQVMPDEILSDHAYVYRRNTDAIEAA